MGDLSQKLNLKRAIQINMQVEILPCNANWHYTGNRCTSIITFSAIQVVTANRQLALEGISKETLMHAAQSKFNSGMI